MKNERKLTIILVSSVLLAGIMLLLCFLDPDPFSIGKIIGTILLPIWVFGLIPAYVFTYNWLNYKTFHEGVSIGRYLGVMLGFAYFLVPLIIAPFLMTLFYLDVFKKNKKDN